MGAREALKSYFGYEAYKPGQEEIIDSILAVKDVLAIMPTGSGKSWTEEEDRQLDEEFNAGIKISEYDRNI